MVAAGGRLCGCPAGRRGEDVEVFSAVLMKGMVWMGVPHSLGSGSASLATLPAHLVFHQLMPSSLLP